jgi:galactokinase
MHAAPTGRGDGVAADGRREDTTRGPREIRLMSYSFVDLYGASPDVEAWAPGRVNLIGEHTDYQGGFVFPMAMFRGTRVRLRRRADDRVRLFSASQSGTGIVSYGLGSEARRHDWTDYVQGVTGVARGAGHAFRGFDAFVTSDLPLGGGLSSSAALEVAMLRGLRRAFGLVMDDLAIAHLAFRAETEFVGVPVGMMDQVVCSVGDPHNALYLDTRSLEWQKIPLPREMRVVIIDSGVPHKNAQSGYRERRQQVEEAARQLGIGQLRDLSLDDLPRLKALPEPLGRRARHVVTENARVLSFRTALQEDGRAEIGRLLSASHRSLRDDYEVSTPEIDTLVAIAAGTSGVIGARLTGGGFGGSVVALTTATHAAAAATTIAAAYARDVGRTPVVIFNDDDERKNAL